MIHSISNLVFEGGGVRGIAYGGAIEAWAKADLLSHIKGVAGTSAGAITACAVALKYSAVEISNIIAHMDLASFEDKDREFRRMKDFGLYEGEVFLAWIGELIANSTIGQGKTDLTFEELVARKGMDLKVYATDLFTQSLKEFSVHTTPSVPIAEAVRASMSIPLYFDAWKFSNNNPDDHFYVDGGVMYNFPIGAFDKPEEGKPNTETLGFNLMNLSGQEVFTPFEHGDFGKYTKSLLNTLLYTQIVALEKSVTDSNRTVTIDHLGVGATDFEIDRATKNKLLQSGWDITVAFLQKQGIDTSAFGSPTLLDEDEEQSRVLS
ncbi:MAG: patatin-like phospholipase family protein [Bacteroidota bacterium]